VAGNEYERIEVRIKPYLQVQPDQFDCLRQSRPTIDNKDEGRILN
jgi:hypothetical protein